MEAQAKQQVVERIKQASNILVTVSKNPSVDQLASSIGLTLLLNSIGKHTTAVFSGKAPSTIEFLQPEKTFQTTTDSLRDFIISLDKEKADKLRYKVEDQFVRIFITPYKTSLSEKDLLFAQGDYNVDLILALGVQDAAQLDAAIIAHGKILHDATVISVNAHIKASKLGQLNWIDPNASSLSEMIVSISESFGPSLIDSQMATAFLTGIVAETDRFKNPKTTPKVMTMSAQLMAAGANQQLIASKLEAQVVIPRAKPVAGPAPEKKPEVMNDGTLNVNHLTDKDSPEVDIDTGEIRIDQEGNIKKAAEEAAAVEAARQAIATHKDAPAEAAQPPIQPVFEVQPEPPKQEAPQPEVVMPPELTQVIEAPQPTTESAPPPPAPPGQQEDMPGSHSVIDNEPITESPFSAVSEDEESSDPLTDNGIPRIDGFLGHAKDVKPLDHGNESITAPPVEQQARNAVEQAYAKSADNPAAEALSAVTPQPMDVPSPNQDQPQDFPAPPPFPPPLTTPQGVVIPPSNQAPNQGSDH